MAFARLVFAVVISFAVACVPAAGSAAMLQTMDAPAGMSMDSHDPMNCCDPPGDSGQDRNTCTATLACALKCFNFSAAEYSVLPLFAKRPLAHAMRADGVTHGAISGTPFRPPRG